MPPPARLRASATAPRALPALALLLALVPSSCSDPGGAASSDARAVAWDPSAPVDVVLVVVDTLRADAVVDEDGDVRVPALAALAEDGVVFSRCFAHAPQTLPSHTAIFASRTPLEVGVLDNRSPLPPDLPLLALHLREQGYATGAAVALGALAWEAERNLGRGFDVFRPCTGLRFAEDAIGDLEEVLAELDAHDPLFAFLHLADPHDPYRAHGTEDRRALVRRNGEPLLELPISEGETWRGPVELAPGENRFEIVAEEDLMVRSFVPRHRGQVLEWRYETGERRVPASRFELVAENPTDGPLVAQLTLWLEDVPRLREAKRRYALEVEYVDRFVGRILDDLRARGRYDDALVVFTSDHGEELQEHGFRGHVKQLYDESLHVPLIVKPPAGHPRAADLRAAADLLVRQVDLAPTVLHLLDLPALPGQTGRSLLVPGERVLVASTHTPYAPRDLVCLRDDRFKLIYDATGEGFEMYDLVEDPGEEEDVFDEARGERPDWPDLLRGLAASTVGSDAELDAELQIQLEALGYAGH